MTFPGMTITVRHIHLSRLLPHPSNIRRDIGDITDLANSMKVHGVLEPLLAQPNPERRGYYYIEAGHRRRAAALRADLETAPVILRPSRSTPAAIETMLVENCHRRGLNPMDKAEAMAALRDRYGYTEVQIGQKTGLSDATVSIYLALLELDTATRDKVRNRDLSVADAVKAVRRVRARRRRDAGHAPHGAKLTWEPDHFTRKHPLARAAAAECVGRGHNMRRRLGDVAYGQCWEKVIRSDAIASCQPLEPSPPPQTKRQARIEDYVELRTQGLTRQHAAERLGITLHTAEGYERTLRERAALSA